jgi:hypothetical protein
VVDDVTAPSAVESGWFSSALADLDWLTFEWALGERSNLSVAVSLDVRHQLGQRDMRAPGTWTQELPNGRAWVARKALQSTAEFGRTAGSGLGK